MNKIQVIHPVTGAMLDVHQHKCEVTPEDAHVYRVGDRVRWRVTETPGVVLMGDGAYPATAFSQDHDKTFHYYVVVKDHRVHAVEDAVLAGAFCGHAAMAPRDGFSRGAVVAQADYWAGKYGIEPPPLNLWNDAQWAEVARGVVSRGRKSTGEVVASLIKDGWETFKD